MKITESVGKIRVGMIVRTNGNGARMNDVRNDQQRLTGAIPYDFISGVVTRVNFDQFSIKRDDGLTGAFGDWIVRFNSPGDVHIFTEQPVHVGIDYGVSETMVMQGAMDTMMANWMRISSVHKPLIINKEKETMPKLSTMLKKLIDQPTKDLIEAGFIDKDLDITQRGHIALTELLFEKHKDELAALAVERIAEEKEAEECDC